MPARDSLATAQRPVPDSDVSHPLWPPLTAGCPVTSTERVQVPLEVEYDYDAVDPALFDAPIEPGLERWAPLMPPLAGPSLKAGATPLLETPALADWANVDAAVHVKDESRNPTWSHKDRLNRLAVGTGVRADARGIVASSSGNHGASAAAHAARAGLPCVVLTAPDTPPAMLGFMRAYGAAVLRVSGWTERTALVDALADRGVHPVTSRTRIHTGHPYGPEGYKPIAYELLDQLGTVPGEVYVPTAHAELLYGIWKGFRELARLDVTVDTPRMVACEPGPQAALAEARARGEPIVSVDAGPSAAHSIGGATSTHRGYVGLEESDGVAVPVPEATLADARDAAAAAGLWQELSGTASLGGLRAAAHDPAGPVVLMACSSGFKDGSDATVPEVEPDLTAVVDALAAEYGLELDSGPTGAA